MPTPLRARAAHARPAMRADTFARLLVLEALVDAEIGYLLEHRPPAELFRAGMIARVGLLVEEIDAVDAVAAARVYDALVDFLAGFPEDDDGVVEATVGFKRALDRTVQRASAGREPADAATWAVVLDELLASLAREYAIAIPPDGAHSPREYLRARALLARARSAAERMCEAEPAERRAEVRCAMDRLGFAVHYRRVPPAALEPLVAEPQRLARRHRPSNLARIGAFVVAQLVKRRAAVAEPEIAP